MDLKPTQYLVHNGFQVNMSVTVLVIFLHIKKLLFGIVCH
jgi:hypothetical protein